MLALSIRKRLVLCSYTTKISSVIPACISTQYDSADIVIPFQVIIKDVSNIVLSPYEMFGCA